MFGQARLYLRLIREVRDFLKEPFTLEQSRRIIEERLKNREGNLLALVKKAIYENDGSPYLKLLKLAGCEYGDFERMVHSDGVEGALQKLCKEGVYITIEEFKGKKEVRRGGKWYHFTSEDFDNPLLRSHLQVRSSGSRSAGTRSFYNLDFITQNVVLYNLPVFDAHDASSLPIAMWMPAMYGAGPLNLLAYTKGGNPPRKWFSPLESEALSPSIKDRMAVTFFHLLGWVAGVRWPRPEYAAYDDAGRVARWMADIIKEEGGCVLDTYASAAIRVCRAARESGLDISGAVFIIGGEPVTQAKLREIESVGARASIIYGISEAGFVGASCLAPATSDDIHLFHDSFALIQHERVVPHAEVSVNAFLFTSLLPSAPKILFNVESGDYGGLEERSCGCKLGELGFSRHLSSIRGFDRLTSEGMSFLGGDLVRIIEEVLPSRFGGSSADYQLVEEEEEGQTRLTLVVSPSVGDLDEEEVIRLTIEELAKGRSVQGMMAQVWKKAGTLRVRRAQPITTGSGKLLPLHIEKSRER